MTRKDESQTNIIMNAIPLLFIPIAIIGTIKFIKLLNPIAKIKRAPKTLSLDGISFPITLEELKRIENFSDNIISDDAHCQNNEDRHIEVSCSGKQFASNKCSKKFIFCNGQLSICNYVFENLSSKSNKIYKELIKTNGKPDKKRYNKKICCLQCIWHGENGEIVYYKFLNSLIVIVFEINKISDTINTI